MKKTKVEEPSILTAKTYFWKPAESASGRRRNEERHLSEVALFFNAIGMSVERNGDKVTGVAGAIKAVFQYSESCKNVYKSLDITNNGKRSNIRLLRNYY